MLSAFYGGAGATEVSSAKSTIPVQVNINQISEREGEVDENKIYPLTLEQYVREYFEEEPILAEIAKCESTFRHFGKNGKVIRGIQNREDVGLMQINEYFHGDSAKKNGFDIYSLEGNMSYAKWLYERQGSVPWVHSSKCWKKSEHFAKK